MTEEGVLYEAPRSEGLLAGLLFVEAEPFPSAGPNWMERLEGSSYQRPLRSETKFFAKTLS